MPAVKPHHTATTDSAWDAGENEKRLPSPMTKKVAEDMYAWIAAGVSADDVTKSDGKFPHHEASDGTPGAANVKACSSIIAVLNGGRGGSSIPTADRQGVYDHAKAHLEDAGEKNIPDLKAKAEAPACTEMRFDAAGAASVLPSTANTNDRTVDVVWYTGVSVPRVNQATGKPYNLRLDMAGARLDRLNNGAPIFDNHQAGNGFLDKLDQGKPGLRAQVGVVQKAWADGALGKATLQFKQGVDQSPDKGYLDQLWSDVRTGIIQNLSFGTWIYDMQPDPNNPADDDEPPTPLDDESDDGPQSFVATDWEPFEISPVCVPADFSTAFLSAQPVASETAAAAPPTTLHLSPQTVVTIHTTTTPAADVLLPEITRAPAREEQTPLEPQTVTPGTEAQQQASAVNTEALRQEGARLERERAQAIRLSATPFAGQLSDNFVNSLVDEGLSLEASRDRILTKLAANGSQPPILDGPEITRDQTDTRRENMEAALLVRHDPKGYVALADKAREYVGLSLVEIGRECLEAAGVKTRGIPKHEIARIALQGRFGASEYFAGGLASTSDFPSILANVANKTLRQAYETYPNTFKPFCRMVTASDFKPVNRVQLSDISALKPLNESGEYVRNTPSDSKETYSLATYGEVIAVTRKTIINDDLQAFTRIPMLLGVAAARLEADTVWAIFTANPNMSDSIALFNASHSNLNSGSGSVLGTAGLASARTSLRLQTAPKGTPLNLTPKYLVVPAALEQSSDQLVSPINIASTDFTKVVPQWIRSLQPIVEPRLDASSATAWYLIADPATIDTIEYCYLEGQAGVYTETRQGFEVDGVEIKARMDFAAAAVEYRGLQQNAGA